MTNKNHKWIIVISLFGAPILFYLFAALSSILLNNIRPEYVGTGPGFGAALIWVISGTLSFFTSLVLGPLLNHLSKKKNKPRLADIGYISPPVTAFIFASFYTLNEVLKITL